MEWVSYILQYHIHIWYCNIHIWYCMMYIGIFEWGQHSIEVLNARKVVVTEYQIKVSEHCQLFFQTFTVQKYTKNYMPNLLKV